MILIFDRAWAMPSKHTFTIKPIRKLIREEMIEGASVDPFAGLHSPANITNDLNPDIPATHNMDALKFLKSLKTDRFMLGFYDPPYSVRQAAECYRSVGLGKLTASVTNFKYWSDCKDQFARIISPGGKVISFGWSTTGLGINRGFEISRILLVCHGGAHNDTIVTVENKNQMTLE